MGAARVDIEVAKAVEPAAGVGVNGVAAVAVAVAAAVTDKEIAGVSGMVIIKPGVDAAVGVVGGHATAGPAAADVF